MRSVACVLCTLITLLVLSFSATAAPAAQAAGPGMDSGERAVVRAINRARAANGRRALRPARRLARAANAHTLSMLRSNYFSHGAFSARLRRYTHARRVGETIAMSTRCSASRIVRMWMHSPPHRAVLLSGGFRRVGIGRRRGNLGTGRSCVVTADFASRR